MPTMIRIPLTNSAKLSARTTPKLTRLWPQSMTEAAAAPARPMRPSTPSGSRSSLPRKASTARVINAVATTMRIGMTAWSSARFMDALPRWRRRAARPPRRLPAARGVPRPGPGRRRSARPRPGRRARTGARKMVGNTPITTAIATAGPSVAPLARRQVGQRRVLRIGDLAVVHALEHPEHVDGRQDDAARRHHGQLGPPAEAAEDGQELADEAVQAGQADRRQRDDQEGRDQLRHHRLQAAELGDQARVPAIREHADDDEEPAGADAVRQHLVDGALHALDVHRRRCPAPRTRGG